MDWCHQVGALLYNAVRDGGELLPDVSVGVLEKRPRQQLLDKGWDVRRRRQRLVVVERGELEIWLLKLVGSVIVGRRRGGRRRRRWRRTVFLFQKRFHVQMLPALSTIIPVVVASPVERRLPQGPGTPPHRVIDRLLDVGDERPQLVLDPVTSLPQQWSLPRSGIEVSASKILPPQ